MGKKYIIFDFDGTLCNTNDIIVESWQATFERFLGRSLPRREIEATFGEVLANTIEEKIPGAVVQDVVDYYREYQNANQEGKVHIFEGVRELTYCVSPSSAFVLCRASAEKSISIALSPYTGSAGAASDAVAASEAVAAFEAVAASEAVAAFAGDAVRPESVPENTVSGWPKRLYTTSRRSAVRRPKVSTAAL